MPAVSVTSPVVAVKLPTAPMLVLAVSATFCPDRLTTLSGSVLKIAPVSAVTSRLPAAVMLFGGVPLQQPFDTIKFRSRAASSLIAPEVTVLRFTRCTLMSCPELKVIAGCAGNSPVALL